jgi:hypothetical protein
VKDECVEQIFRFGPYSTPFSCFPFLYNKALVLLAFWSAGMSTIVDPDAEPALAVDADREVNDANLFFSSWAAFTLSLVLFIKSSQHILGVHGTSTMEWVGLATANFITMAVGAQGWNDSDCGDVDGGNEEIYCDRTGFAIILGLVSGVAAVGMSLLRHKMVLQLASIISLVAWCFGVAYITYEKGPGNKVGVLFCSTWTSLVISLYLAVKSVQEFIADRAQSGEEGVTAAKDDDTDEHPMHDEESPEEGLKDVPRTDVKNSTEEEEGPPGVLKFKNSLDEIEEYEIEEIDDDGNAVEIEEKEEDDDDDESNKDEAAEKVAGGSFGGTSS